MRDAHFNGLILIKDLFASSIFCRINYGFVEVVVSHSVERRAQLFVTVHSEPQINVADEL